MPRFDVTDGDLAALVAYLRTLGASTSPGVDEGELHLATILADDAPPAARLAVETVLRAFVEDKNARVRNDRARARARRAPNQAPDPYRAWTLDVWELTGPSDAWPAQLEQRYRARPEFAVIGGVAGGPWTPIDRFCEDHGLPCLLPSTDRPPAETGFYSLYYSSGLRLEARVAAADLRDAGLRRVVQWVPRGDEAAAEAAATLATAIDARIEVVEPDADPSPPPDVDAVVSWLGHLPGRADGPPIYASATRLGGRWGGAPAAVRVVDPYRLATERDPALDRFRAWARARGVEIEDERIAAQTWFACVTLLDAADHVSRTPSATTCWTRWTTRAGCPRSSRCTPAGRSVVPGPVDPRAHDRGGGARGR
jgi:hypothetical protein